MKTKFYRSKWAATMDSRNFLVTLISLILLTLEFNNLGTGIDAETIWEAFASGELGRILSIVLVNFLNPIMKIIRGEASWSFGFLKSKNFWTQALTGIFVLLAGLGIAFPDGAAASLVEAIFGGSFEAISIAIVINVINPLYHFFFDRDKGEKPGKERKARDALPSY